MMNDKPGNAHKDSMSADHWVLFEVKAAHT